MDLRDTLAQLPPDYPVTLRLGVYEYVSPAAEWLEQDLTQYELVTNIVLPDQPASPLPDHLQPYQHGDIGGTISEPNNNIYLGPIGEW
ncbi:hypothetical protein LCGC14_2152610, partial [marine sediment metagenome]